MKISLPSSRNKRYLTGMDWMIHALDYSSRKQLGCGTAFQIVMETTSPLKSAVLEKSLSDYCGRFPHLSGKVSRDFNLAPYWKSLSEKKLFKLKSFKVSNFAEAHRQLEAELNQPFEVNALPFRVISAEMPHKGMIGFIFDHRLFDARGAERFLHDFQTDYLAGNKTEITLPSAPAHLDRWDEQFAAGKQVNRARIAQQNAHTSPVYVLEPAGSFKGTQNHFKVKTFSEEETRLIFEKAGPFMFLPYALAAGVRAVHAVFSQRGQNEGGLKVSVTRDMRPGRGMSLPETFFNHLSFMFFQIKASDAANFDLLVQNLKSQFYEQVKNKMPEALADAGMLMRILPLSVLSRGIQVKKYAPASFSFASLGESAYQHENFMGADVERLFHLPRIPPLPGLGIFFSQYKRRLNVTLSYLDSLLSEEEAEHIFGTLVRL